jgi:hypothetical protein
MAEKQEKGMTSEDKGVFIPMNERMPYSPQYLHMSKSQVIEAEQRRKDKELRLKEVAAEIDREHEVKTETKTEVPKIEAKPKGRPKKIE